MPLVDNVLLAVKALGGKTPAVTEHPSRQSALLDRRDYAALAEEATEDLHSLKILVCRTVLLIPIPIFFPPGAEKGWAPLRHDKTI